VQTVRADAYPGRRVVELSTCPGDRNSYRFDMHFKLSPAKTVFSFLAIITALVLTATVHAKESGEVSHPGPGTAPRKAILDGLRPWIEDDLKQKVIFIVGDMRVLSDWAFVRVTPVRPDSKPIDFTKTKYKEAMQEGMFDGATTYALLRKKGDRWAVLTFRIGPTDVCWAGWENPPYGAPRKILPYGDKP
jgi:hypothetical protein